MASPGEGPHASPKDSCPACQELMLRLSACVQQLAQLNTELLGALTDWEIGISPQPDGALLEQARLLRLKASRARHQLQEHRSRNHMTAI